MPPPTSQPNQPVPPMRAAFLAPSLPLRLARALPRALSGVAAPPRAALRDGGRGAAADAMFAHGVGFGALGAAQPLVERLEGVGLCTPTVAQREVVPRLLAGTLRMVEYGRRVREAREAFEEGGLVGEVVVGEEMEVGEEGEEGEEGEDVFVRPEPPEDGDDVVMLGAETGSGKTLAYLLPYVEAVGREPGYPVKAIVMVPSRELCFQVARQLEMYFPDAPPHLVLAGGRPPDVSDMKSVRVVIATPAALLNWFRFSDKVDGNDKYIVVDEADMLLSGGFLRDVERVLDQPGMKPFATRKNGPERAVNRNRLVFVGATYPHWTGEKVKSIVTWMRKRYPAIATVQTDAIHRRSVGIADSWHYLPSDEERMEKLERILSDDCGGGDKVMVFCGQAAGAEGLHQALVQMFEGGSFGETFGGVVRLHKNVPVIEREEALAAFRAGDVRLLVCTDLAARGLDLGSVTRIIEYDFSTNVVGYLHRIGRTARAGASGATNHFYDDTTRPLADAIRKRSGENVPVVDGVFSRDRSFRRKLRKQQRTEAE